MSDTECLFCKIIMGESPASTVYDDEDIIAFLDLYPLNPGHVLVVPKHHAATLDELDNTSAVKMMQVAVKVVAALQLTEEIPCTGTNLFMANGKSAGQEIYHSHLHVIPRFETDEISFGGPVRPTKRSRRELDRCAAVISNFIR